MGFELCHRETLIFIGLRQERLSLRRTECRGLTIERSDGAISTHVFQDRIPTHTTTPFLVDAGDYATSDFRNRCWRGGVFYGPFVCGLIQ